MPTSTPSSCLAPPMEALDVVLRCACAAVVSDSASAATTIPPKSFRIPRPPVGSGSCNVDGPPGYTPDGPSNAAMSLTPERHAQTGANIKAARNALAAVFEVVAQEPFHTPGVGLHRNPLADATVQRQLRRGRARPTWRG